MDVSNRYYGHDIVLARYCGLRGPMPIRGELQHGWNPTYGIVAEEGRPKKTPLRRFLWSRRNVEWCLRAGIANVEAIGAPFLYHRHADRPPRSGTLLVCPFHGWEGGKVHGSFEEYTAALEQLRTRFQEITVCLYWLEYEDPAVRAIYERAGYRVITNGHRDGNPEFVASLSRNLTDHEYVTTNRMATIAFCALYLGRKFFLYGPTMMAAEEGRVHGENLAREQEEFGMLRFEEFDDRTHREIGERELGLEFRKSPRELKRILGWSFLGLPTLAARARRRLTGAGGER